MLNPSSASRSRRLLAGGTLAAFAAGSALVSAPAGAATSGVLSYTCDVLGNPQSFTASYDVPNLTVEYGGDVEVNTTVTVPAGLVDFIRATGAKKVDGDVTAYAAGSILTLPVTQIIAPPAEVPETGPMTVVAKGGLSLAPYAQFTPAGTVAPITVQDRKAEDGTEASDLDASLYTYDAADNKSGPVAVSCELDDGQDVSVGELTVTQAQTTVKAKIKYAKKAKKVTAKATVKAPNSNVRPDGKVKLTIKKGKKTVFAKKVELSNIGKVSKTLKKAKKGSYKVVAKYLGTGNFTGSKDSDKS